MEIENIFQANFDKSNNFCFFFAENNETKYSIGKTVKFLDFEYIPKQNSHENLNFPLEKSNHNLSIILYTPESVINTSKIVLAEIIIKSEEKSLSISNFANNHTKICEKSYLKLEASNSDTQVYFLPEEINYSFKIAYGNSNNKNLTGNMNNIQSNIKTTQDDNYLHVLKGNFSENDEEDEDYEESELDSGEESPISHLSAEFPENLLKNKSISIKEKRLESLSCEDEQCDANFVQDLFDEAEDINRDLIYFQDEDLEPDSYLNLLWEDETQGDNYNLNRNNISNINPRQGKKRYMLRRKRKPYN